MIFLQNEILTKNEIIKSLTDTQSTILEVLLSVDSLWNAYVTWQENTVKSQKDPKFKHSVVTIPPRMIYTRLYELWLRSTKYLRQNCSVKVSANSNTGKKKYFSYVTAPEHVTNTELIYSSIKWNTVQF